MTAITSQPLNPQYVYVQTSTPSDLTEGKLWYNTTAKALYSSDGSSYSVMETDTSPLQNQLLEMDLNILINSVASSSTLNDWETMFVDIFSDADGTSNTIDTGNTTAIFDTNKYINTEIVLDANEDTELTTQSDTFILQKTFSAINTYIKHGKNEIKTNYNGVTCYCKYIFTYDDESTAEVIMTENGTSYVEKEYLNPNLDKIVTEINVYHRLKTGEVSRMVYLKLDKIYECVIDDLIIQTNAITCTTAQTSHQVYCHNATAGTGAITYDISFDNGSTWDTAQALNTKNTRSSTTGTQMILKLNLNGVSIGNTSQADDYGVMLFY